MDVQNFDVPGDGVRTLEVKLKALEPVTTSQGTLYVRHIAVSDLAVFAQHLNTRRDKVATDLKSLGKLALITLVCIGNSPEKTSALSEGVFLRLTQDDIRSLVGGVAKVCALGRLSEDDTLESLGSALFDYFVDQEKRMVERLAKIKQTLDRGYGSISETVKAALGDNLNGLSAIRENLKMSSAVEGIRKFQEEQATHEKAMRAAYGDKFASLSNIGASLKVSPLFEEIRNFKENQTTYGKQASDLLSQLKEGSAAEKAYREIHESQQSLSDGLSKSFQPQVERDSVKTGGPTLEVRIPTIHFPKVEETPLGRAALAGEESARQLREVAGLAGQMTEKIGSISELVVTRVLPEWYQSLQDGTQATNTALMKADHSLRLAKWAIIVSILVTVAMTSWQVYIAREYKLENDAQQANSEAILRQQLDAIRGLNMQLSADSKCLREEMISAMQSVDSGVTAKATESKKATENRTAR